MPPKTTLLSTIPVLPTEDMARDVAWYAEKTGFTKVGGDDMYAILQRENLELHLQWHANTEDDPLLGGSVVRIHVENILPIFEEFVQRGTVSPQKLRMGTDWGTNEFGFYDPNKNAIFIMEDV
ncbi:glyoxalase/bleomycin resistance/extradiol dioxygenase family protein [Lewinella sp. W8]|uniref:glyoxalase/bleomycin resistance/extradiol dioxygenase family protein n=1 Tax=Lewinella sp. W8 TaxID=2528208 RepID=UPI0010679108|nr:glyoxalase/bleomycin resistance/extradiol dioxygenase family protein [Lewinella sp. W8]MTB53623.1 glyoxalase/bleomycin resistance/extradiol dioxygenase family protein [Lewinella sp. W8]